MSNPAAPVTPVASSSAPERQGAVLATLILVAAVANLPLAVANVALPDIGLHFNASQTELNLVAVSYSLGLACSVLWFGALGDRYGRKQMLLFGVVLSAFACPVMAWAPTIGVLIAGRIVGGLAAGMAYPTTLSLITALWSGPARTRSIALWSAMGGAISALGPLAAGLLLEHFWWGSVFLVTLPLIVVALPLAHRLIPSHVNEDSDAVDNLGGVLSALLVGAVILAINFAAVPDSGTLLVSLVIIAVAAIGAFILRERRAAHPLYDLHIAGRRIFWVAACAGIIVFGSLMGAMFIGQQFLQNVLGYSTIDAGLAILPAPVFMVLIAPRSAKLVETRGARFTLMVGYACIMAGFLTMLIFWKDGVGYWAIGLGYAFIGAGVGFAGTPASHSLTGSVPVTRVGMASGTADLQRDLGGAIMQSIMGALLTAGYASAAAAAIAGSPQSGQINNNVQSELTKSFDGAADIAKQYPQYSQQIIAAAKQSFTHGQDWAYAAGIIAVAIGAVIVWFFFPMGPEEKRLLEEYHAIDTQAGSDAAATTGGAEVPTGDGTGQEPTGDGREPTGVA
ncbi:MAG TPA: MFS transporter [Acidimicrobiales bacterium]|nr:MFS transporter [Acidimicrobiales bacterium]